MPGGSLNSLPFVVERIIFRNSKDPPCQIAYLCAFENCCHNSRLWFVESEHLCDTMGHWVEAGMSPAKTEIQPSGYPKTFAKEKLFCHSVSRLALQSRGFWTADKLIGGFPFGSGPVTRIAVGNTYLPNKLTNWWGEGRRGYHPTSPTSDERGMKKFSFLI